MRKFPRTLIIGILILAAFAISVSAQENVCCCAADGTAEPDTPKLLSECPVTHQQFYIPTPEEVVEDAPCSQLCLEQATVPPITTGECGSPEFKPPPGNFNVIPVKGEAAMRLEWEEICPASAYLISRCTGTGCTSFASVGLVGPSTSFVDGSPEIRWNTDYTYQIVAKYSIQGDSLPGIDSANTGDIECVNQFTQDSFCISSFYYDGLQNYLQNFGYVGSPPTPAADFNADFDATINLVFFQKMNTGYRCDVDNSLSEILSTCGGGEVCVAQGTQVQCLAAGPCDPSSGLFGFGATIDSCEGTDPNINYCFLDRSPTSVNDCYQCSQALSCYDYRSEDACNRNNCGLGDCAWKDTFPDVGAGVCVDTRFNNCYLCDQTGTVGAPNSLAYNLVIDQCSPKKATALSTTENPCFLSGGQALDCSQATCRDYTPGQCSSPPGGILINADNSIAQGSNDPCGIGVCQFDAAASIQCRKNADGTPEADFWPDCDPTLPLDENLGCERDYFPPLTTFIPIGGAGKFDYINVRIWEKSNSSDFGHIVLPPGDLTLTIGNPEDTGFGTREEIPGWDTYVCAGLLTDPLCTDFENFSSTQLNFNDLNLQDGQNVLLTLEPGWNRLRFYTQDPSKNLEVMKNLSVFACVACQGPKVLEFNLTPGNLIDDTFYIRSLQPTGNIQYNENTEQIFAGFLNDTVTITMDTVPASGFNLEYDLSTPDATPLSEGDWIFSANAKDEDNVLMDEPLSVPVVVDITPPNATYTPADGEVVTNTPITVTIVFSEKVLYQNFTLIEERVYDTFAGPIKVPEARDITALFTTNDDITFTAQLTVEDGRKWIAPGVTDYAGNPLTPDTAQSLFILNEKEPVITLLQPSFGVSSEFTFDMIFETDSVAECRYWSSQFLPPPGSFNALIPFDETNAFEHRKIDFDEINEVNTPFKVFVKCKDTDTGESDETFWLHVDKSDPNILSAFAVPSTIAQLPLQTTLKVQTDDRTFCRYSPTTSNYDSMEGEFPWFGILGLFAHTVNVTVPVPDDYTYHVACKNLADLGPDEEEIDFDVDLNQELMLNSITPKYWGNTTVPVGIESNKDTFCYYDLGGTLKPLGSVNQSAMAHVEIIDVPGAGQHSWTIYCSTGSGTSALGIEEKSINVTVFVDLTPPWMIYVNDTSNNPFFPEFSYFLDRLKIAFLGDDNETEVTRYHYRIENQDTNIPVRNWTPSAITNGLPWWTTGLDLTDGETYYFRVKPENQAGVEGNEMPSDGVTIDITKIPPYCVNELFDPPNETDIDCGGLCPPCADNRTCVDNLDCLSNICNSSMICQPSFCDDLILGGEETDIDCGGNECDGCDNGLVCADNSDCASNYCNAGICDDNPCFNGMLDGLESDIDCGGACINGCQPGQSCVVEADCAGNASCFNNVCFLGVDTDSDGVPDALDNCPNTRFGQPVDEFGCSAEQRFTCGDQINDAWRILFFGEVLCDGDGAPDADPDRDGLTNLEEFLGGTDPTESDRAPFPWLTVIIILIILVALGVGGWYLYKHPEIWKKIKSKFHKKKVPVTRAPVRPTIAPKKAVAPHLEQWVSMRDLKKLGPKDMSTRTFNKLDSLIKGTLPEHEHAKLLKTMEREKSPIDKLRELALNGLSAKEKRDLLNQLRLLRQGKLTKAQIEKLFRKLRITAAYYKTHRDRLERELEAFGRGERIRKRRK